MRQFSKPMRESSRHGRRQLRRAAFRRRSSNDGRSTESQNHPVPGRVLHADQRKGVPGQRPDISSSRSSFPFLGVHFTQTMKGFVEAGPNAVLATKREGTASGTSHSLNWAAHWLTRDSGDWLFANGRSLCGNQQIGQEERVRQKPSAADTRSDIERSGAGRFRRPCSGSSA